MSPGFGGTPRFGLRTALGVAVVAVVLAWPVVTALQYGVGNALVVLATVLAVLAAVAAAIGME